MSLLFILGVVLLTGFLLWLINVKIPMEGIIGTIFNVIVIVALVLFLLRAFHLIEYLRPIYHG